MASQALASLTATYTDSEGEEDMDEGQETPEKSNNVSPTTQSLPNSPKEPEPEILKRRSSAPSSPKKPKRLVSYQDDTVLSEDDPAGSEDDMRRISMEEDTDENTTPPPPTVEEVSQDGIVIPPEPPGKCPADLLAKMAHYANLMKGGNDMNKQIQDRKSFRNPSIYEKLLDFCNIEELGTNYPPEIYDPLRWGKESYYDELAKAQKIEMDRREKDRKEKLAKIDFTTGIVKKTDKDDDPTKRRSKWDQAAPNSANVKSSIKPAGLIQPALTTNITGTKSTVISAFGSLPKKK